MTPDEASKLMQTARAYNKGKTMHPYIEEEAVNEVARCVENRVENMGQDIDKAIDKVVDEYANSLHFFVREHFDRDV